MKSCLAQAVSAMLGVVLCAAAPQAAVDALSAAVVEPRAFGYSVGDVVPRTVTIDAPARLRLDEASLPQVGRRGKALELRKVTLRTQGRSDGLRHELRLEYQVFVAPPEVRTLEMPAFSLRFDGPARAEALRIDAWPVTVAPLVEIDAPARRGLGEMRPDAAPPLIDTSAGRMRLMACGVLATLLVGYLTQVYVGLPWAAQRRRPFGLAWRALRRLPASPSAAQRRDAFQRLHAALNRTAGEVLFEQGLDRFIAGQPRFARLRADLVAFFERSRDEFFAAANEGDATPGDPAWLIEFCRRCRDAERGVA